MANSGSDKELMRECVVVQYDSGQNLTKNSVFDIDIPEGYALELHEVHFSMIAGSGQVANNITFNLCDDPDETADPGFTAEKVISIGSMVINFNTSGRAQMWNDLVKNAHKTLLVKNPNFITHVAIDPGATVYLYCQIWFDFVRVSPSRILELLRQQQY